MPQFLAELWLWSLYSNYVFGLYPTQYIFVPIGNLRLQWLRQQSIMCGI